MSRSGEDGRPGSRAGEDRVALLTAALHGLDVDRARSWGRLIAQRLARGGRVLAVGNGGSVAQAQHLAAELIGRFETERGPLAALALSADSAVVTALGNDYGYGEVFARQVRAHGRPADVLVAISTSGASANVLAAAAQAAELGMVTLALTGPPGSPLAALCTEAITVAASATSAIQECHLLVVEGWELLGPGVFLAHAWRPACAHRAPAPEPAAASQAPAGTGLGVGGPETVTGSTPGPTRTEFLRSESVTCCVTR